MEVVHVRCAGMDVSKRDAKVCVRVAGRGRGKTVETVQTWASTTNAILRLREHLIAERVTLVVMEATGDYWKPFYYLLEDAGFEVMLVNARQVKNLPGRKSDLLTELSAGSVERCVRCPGELARFPACDQRRGRAAGVVHTGGAAARLAGDDRGSVSAVSAR
jgi:transposase